MQNSILLLSSSNVHGYGFLEYNKDAIVEFVAGLQTPLLFVPYAAGKREWDSYTEKIRVFFRKQGVAVTGAHTVPKDRIMTDYAAIFVGGGNTFRLLNKMQEDGLMDEIRAAVLGGNTRYMGSSAGTNLACKTICTTNDMPIVYPKGGFEALNLLPYQINAHYLDPEPDSKHKGETREQRIAEFHQELDTPVIGLREGAYISISHDFAETKDLFIGGKPGAKIFVKGKIPYEAPIDQKFRI